MQPAPLLQKQGSLIFMFYIMWPGWQTISISGCGSHRACISKACIVTYPYGIIKILCCTQSHPDICLIHNNTVLQITSSYAKKVFFQIVVLHLTIARYTGNTDKIKIWLKTTQHGSFKQWRHRYIDSLLHGETKFKLSGSTYQKYIVFGQDFILFIALLSHWKYNGWGEKVNDWKPEFPFGAMVNPFHGHKLTTLDQN